MYRSIILLGLGALLVGCDSGDTGVDSYDTEVGDDTAPIETEVNEVSYGYDSSKWVYEVELKGWGSGVDIDIYQFEGGYTWEEAHSLSQLDYDPNGTWDKWGITLNIVTDWKDQIDSVNTLFGGDLEDTMTWMVTAYDMDGMFADCAVWGKNKDYYASFGCWELVF